MASTLSIIEEPLLTAGEIRVACPVAAPAQIIENLSCAIDERHRSHLAALRYALHAVLRDVSPHMDRPLGKSTSAHRKPRSSLSRRPVKAATMKPAASCPDEAART
jgi:hypothetical protein